MSSSNVCEALFYRDKIGTVMANYIIGDVHGQFDALTKLLDMLNYDEKNDELWFVGDLVNRGPKSLEVLRFVADLQQRGVAKVVLGNHDFSLMVQALNIPEVRIKKSTMEILQAPDAVQLLHIIRTWPLMVEDKTRKIIMTHAGAYPLWSLEKLHVQHEIYQSYMANTHEQVNQFLRMVYHNGTGKWSETEADIEKMRFTVNAFTRMRFLTGKGGLDFDCKEPPEDAPKRLTPWYQLLPNNGYRYIFGHWAACGLRVTERYACIDSGAAWGGGLTAFNGDTWKVAATISLKTKQTKKK